MLCTDFEWGFPEPMETLVSRSPALKIEVWLRETIKNPLEAYSRPRSRPGPDTFSYPAGHLFLGEFVR